MTTAWGRVEPARKSGKPADYFPYIFAVVAGALAGWVDIKVGDLLFTALLVLAPCILLGVLRPAKPWRWVLLVGVCVPAFELLAHLYLSAETGARPGVWIVPRFSSGHRRSLRRVMMRGVFNNLRAGN